MIKAVWGQLGHVVVTAGLNEACRDKKVTESVWEALRRYIRGDWGEMCEEDLQINDEAVKVGNRIVAKYSVGLDDDIYIITEWDRSVTTLLFTYEY